LRVEVAFGVGEGKPWQGGKLIRVYKGKPTTDPENNTGEGIFFSSRIMKRFAILSGTTIFSHEQKEKANGTHRGGDGAIHWPKERRGWRLSRGFFSD